MKDESGVAFHLRFGICVRTTLPIREAARRVVFLDLLGNYNLLACIL